MNLIDRDDKQLKGALGYIHDLRLSEKAGDATSKPGQIHTYTPEDADQALASSWLVLEVSHQATASIAIADND